MALTGGFEADMTAGHSLGEFSALVAAGVLTFEEGLHLVSIRANAMQKACDAAPSTMAAIVGIDDAVLEQVCASIISIGGPRQLQYDRTIGDFRLRSRGRSRHRKGQSRRRKNRQTLGCQRCFPFAVHAARRRGTEKGIHAANFKNAQIPVYQNFTALPETDKEKIKANLIAQLTGPSARPNGGKHDQGRRRKFIECGPGKVLAGLIKRVDKTLLTENFD